MLATQDGGRNNLQKSRADATCSKYRHWSWSFTIFHTVPAGTVALKKDFVSRSAAEVKILEGCGRQGLAFTVGHRGRNSGKSICFDTLTWIYIRPAAATVKKTWFKKNVSKFVPVLDKGSCWGDRHMFEQLYVLLPGSPLSSNRN